MKNDIFPAKKFANWSTVLIMENLKAEWEEHHQSVSLAIHSYQPVVLYLLLTVYTNCTYYIIELYIHDHSQNYTVIILRLVQISIH